MYQENIPYNSYSSWHNNDLMATMNDCDNHQNYQVFCNTDHYQLISRIKDELSFEKAYSLYPSAEQQHQSTTMNGQERTFQLNSTPIQDQGMYYCNYCVLIITCYVLAQILVYMQIK